jgi:hypothetical protein
MLAVADATTSLVITGTGDVLDTSSDRRDRLGGPTRRRPPAVAWSIRALSAEQIVKQSLVIAATCALHNQQHVIEVLPANSGAACNRDDADVVVAGAGLVGMALAPALARAGLNVALIDRGPVAAPEFDADTWDARVYAISPGSATFLRSIGAWQMLPPERIEAIEVMHVAGDAGATIEFSAYEWASARWPGSSRSARCARRCCRWCSRPASTSSTASRWHPWTARPKVRRSRLPGRADPRVCWRQDWSLEPMARGRGSGRRRDSLRSRSPMGNRGRRQFRMRTRAPWCRAAMVLRRRQHTGVAAAAGRRIAMVWSAPDAMASQLMALDAPALAKRVAAAGATRWVS